MPKHIKSLECDEWFLINEDLRIFVFQKQNYMKLKIVLFSFLVLAVRNVNAQSHLQTVKFSISEEEIKKKKKTKDEVGKLSKADLGSLIGSKETTTMLMNDKNYLITSSIESGYFNMLELTYYNDSSKILTMFTNTGQYKSAYFQTEKERMHIRKKDVDSVWIEYSDSTKMIAQSMFHFATIITTKKNKRRKTYVWYMKDKLLPMPYDFGYAGVDQIKGIPVVIESEEPNGNSKRTTISALELNPTINASTFKLPSGYKIIPYKEWLDQNENIKLNFGDAAEGDLVPM